MNFAEQVVLKALLYASLKQNSTFGLSLLNPVAYMGIVVRQSVKSVIVTLGGVLMGALVVILSTRFFPKAEYGFTQNLIKIALQISYLGIFGFNYTLLIYGQRYPPGHPARGTFLTITALCPLVISLLITLFYFMFQSRIVGLYQADDARMMRQYFVLFPILTFFSVLISWLEGYLQSLHKTALQHFARELLARVVYVALIILFAMGWIQFKTFIWLYVITYLIPLLFLLIVAMRSKGFHFEWNSQLFAGKDIREIFRFSGYHMLTVVSTVLLLQMDAFLLAPLAKDGFEAVAVYSVAGVAVSILRNPTRIIGLTVIPTFTKTYMEGNVRELSRLFKRSAINMQIIGVGMFLLICLNANNIDVVMGMINGGYEQVKWLMLILMLGQLCDMLSGLNFELIGVTKYYRFNFWIAIALLLVVFVLGFWWIRHWGVYGAAWATTIGLVIFNLAKILFLNKKLHMQPFYKETAMVLGSGVLLAVLIGLMPGLSQVFLDITLRTLLFCGIWWWILYRLKVSVDLNDITRNLLDKKRFY